MEQQKFSFLTNEEVNFSLNYDEIAYKINQILPFSFVLTICDDKDFFAFKPLFKALKNQGLKLVSIVYNIFLIPDARK